MDVTQQQRCPRCNSLNTKFCYYNNYNPSQPRYRCKNCRRYWTLGGTLRNVPVGGGHRRPRRRPGPPTVEDPVGPVPLPPSSTAQLQNQPGPVPVPVPAPGPSNAPVSENDIGIVFSAPMIPSIASSASSMQTQYPAGGLILPSPLPTIDQTYAQLMNLDGDLFGVSGWSMLQGFNFPSFNPPQPPQGNPNNSQGLAWPSVSNGGNPGGGLV